MNVYIQKYFHSVKDKLLDSTRLSQGRMEWMREIT